MKRAPSVQRRQVPAILLQGLMPHFLEIACFISMLLDSFLYGKGTCICFLLHGAIPALVWGWCGEFARCFPRVSHGNKDTSMHFQVQIFTLQITRLLLQRGTYQAHFYSAKFGNLGMWLSSVYWRQVSH